MTKVSAAKVRRKTEMRNTISTAFRITSTTDTVSQIAYALGFEYPQYFSRLFKKQTGMTPQEFRRAG